MIKRIVDFLFSPSPDASKGPPEKKKKAKPVKKVSMRTPKIVES